MHKVWKSYRTLIKEIKELSKWRDNPCYCTGRCNMTEMPVPPSLTYKFNAEALPLHTDEAGWRWTLGGGGGKAGTPRCGGSRLGGEGPALKPVGCGITRLGD